MQNAYSFIFQCSNMQDRVEAMKTQQKQNLPTGFFVTLIFIQATLPIDSTSKRN